MIQTSGLESGAAEALAEIDGEFRDDPGSDGLSKLQVWASLASSDPPSYTKIMNPTSLPGSRAFGAVCSFISTLAESDVAVYATASDHPESDEKATKALAEALGCRGFYRRSYHPTTLYDTLKIPQTATSDDIKASYITLAKTVHPDVTGSDGKEMESVVEAYGVLEDGERRRLYDEEMVADLAFNEEEEDFFGAVSGKSM